MMRKSHMTAGFVCMEVGAILTHNPVSLPGAFIAMYAALLPDLDHPKGYLGRRFWIIPAALSAMNVKHRTATHSLLIAAFMTALVAGVAPIVKVVEWIWWMVVIHLADAVGHWPTHPFHGVGWHTPFWVILAFGTGFISHDLADFLTVEGLEFFWPWHYRIKIPLIGFHTDSIWEHWVVEPLMLVLAAILFIHLTAMQVFPHGPGFDPQRLIWIPIAHAFHLH